MPLIFILFICIFKILFFVSLKQYFELVIFIILNYHLLQSQQSLIYHEFNQIIDHFINHFH
jgi:hypothetical protein